MPKVYARRSRKQKAAARRAMVDSWNKVMIEAYGTNTGAPNIPAQDYRIQSSDARTLIETDKKPQERAEGWHVFKSAAVQRRTQTVIIQGSLKKKKKK